MLLPFPHKKRIKNFGEGLPGIQYASQVESLTSNSICGHTHMNPQVCCFSQGITCGHVNCENEEMLYRFIAAVLPLSLPTNEKHVLTLLAIHANTEGECWPSVGLLAKEACLSHREVQKCLRWLEQGSFIESEQEYGHSTLYKIPLSNSHYHPRPLDTQNIKLNALQEKFQPSPSCVEANCRCVGGKERHYGCTLLPPSFWQTIKKINPKRRKSHV